MISNREPVSTSDIAVRMIAAAASLLMIGAFVGCGEGRTTGNGMTSGTTPPNESTGAGGSSTVSPSGAGGSQVIGASTGTAGGQVIGPSTGTGGIAMNPDMTSNGQPQASCADSSTPGAAPPIYVSECSSCHGMTADGRNGYPSLRTATLTFADVTAIVRAGRVSTTLKFTTAQGNTIPATMPAFSQARLSDADLAAIFAYRSAPASTNAPVPAVYCLSRPEASWTPTQVDEAYQRGLKSWRTQGDVDQNACEVRAEHPMLDPRPALRELAGALF